MDAIHVSSSQTFTLMAKSTGALQLLAGTDSGHGKVSETTVDPIAFGRFLIAIFDEWVKEDVGERFVIIFDGMLANTLQVPPPPLYLCRNMRKRWSSGV